MTISYCFPTLYRPESPRATIPCSQYIVPLSQSVAAVHLCLDCRLAQRQLRVPVRSKQGALGLLRRADHPEPVCMLLVAVGGRYVAVVSVRRAVLRESFRLRWLRLLAKSRPISLAVTSMIGRNVFKRKRRRAVAQCGVQPLLSPFEMRICLGQPPYGEAGCDSELLRLSIAT